MGSESTVPHDSAGNTTKSDADVVAEAVIAVVDDVKPSQPIASIDWKNPARQLLLTLILPVSLAFCIDVMAVTLPLVTLVASIICIPLSTVLVIRALLAAFDSVIEIVAPEPTSEGDDSAINSESQTGDIQPDASA